MTKLFEIKRFRSRNKVAPKLNLSSKPNSELQILYKIDQTVSPLWSLKPFSLTREKVFKVDQTDPWEKVFKVDQTTYKWNREEFINEQPMPPSLNEFYKQGLYQSVDYFI